MLRFLAIAAVVIFILFKVFNVKDKMDGAINYQAVEQSNRADLLMEKISKKESFVCYEAGSTEEFKNEEEFTISSNEFGSVYLKSSASGVKYPILSCE